MSSYVWCHGTNCHKSHTLDRVRGSKGSKVLRTKRIKQETEREWYSENDIHNYFCSQGCLMDFMRANIQRLLALAPRTEPLETPINDPEKTQDYYGWKITERGVDTITE
mgnify:CR=1 FL=1|jgi:hypothetical protein